MTIPTLPKGQLFINGQWRDAADGATAPTFNPANELEIMRVAQATLGDVDAAVDAAHDAFENGEWRKMGPHHKARVLNKIGDLIEENADELAALESMDMGKPLAFARHFDIQFIADLFHFYAGVASGQLGGATRQVTPSESGHMPLAYTRKEPLGVIAAITPFNFPMILSCTKIAPALAAGNTFVHKPASATPLTALRMAQLFKDAGLPDGTFNVVTGSGRTVGNALVEHPKVKKIAFTGSTEVGKGILKQSAESLKKVTLELGGKSAHLIFEDADIKQAAQHACIAAFFNKGEFCMAGTRLLVQRSVYDEVLAELVEATKGLVIGDPLDMATTFGPQVDAAARDNCAKYVDIALEDGARLVMGGKPMTVDGKGYYFEPTILADVDNKSRVAQEEIFGPVLAVIPFDTEDEAIALANDSEYGLAAGVQTQNLGRAHRVANAMEAGMVWINTWGQFDSALPFGGYKASGIGREMGIEAMESYTQNKSIYASIE
ncbi:aldehyde dehydrogenase family protein [Vibrio alginolyticus]|uniref:aldehyde dehydrogenase family protein n=1 Tax=unclassified Vibrio TaxID=2614977 RepID=UPI00255254D6|nr:MULTISPECIES: aldehyde dehydrogenase family protein [unclassified Vibrio]ELA9204206.1 aldehyde dehydrogenase family protein [Vibrio alginolyticus]MDK9730232.1 aldehyde dehydrogenase family protein [Vibrio sp. D415a]MDK9748802.1 aldehyde dehydrogenase family protein [Vibrio sp. D409a]MDK9766640.1 aldehyde dehydrogenase family protein [Vibrio sp. D417a]MDK9788910.1 aldehyde dehydrogenase family protein [Vibrio sp. D421a]